MSILDATRTFSAAQLHLAASAGNWSPIYLAYAWLTGAIDPRAAYERDAGASEYLAWLSGKFRGCAVTDPEVRIKLAEEIAGNAAALKLMHSYALLHGLDRVTA